MIIALSGRAGSGKDTVGKLIQYMTAEDVAAGCLGRIREGLSIDGYHNSAFENKKFAGKLKLVGSILSGVPVEMFEDQEFKKQYMGDDWIQPKYFNCENYDEAEGGGNCSFCSCKENQMTYREFLQKLGTEAMRDGLHTNVWVNALFADYRAIERIPEKRMSIMPNWIITDMRFPNEMDAVKDKGGVTIRVNRPVHSLSQENNAVQLHPSETALDNAEFDYVIENSGSFDDLMLKVEAILKKEQIPFKRWSI